MWTTALEHQFGGLLLADSVEKLGELAVCIDVLAQSDPQGTST
jgi:hypothetical protein